MCCCAIPNVNGEPGYSWDGKNVSTRPVDPPTLTDRDVLLFDEPGRCGGMDSHSHHYRLVSDIGLHLLVKHGGGQERIRVSLPRGFSFEGPDSNTRYWMLNAIFHASSDGKAFVEDRLKKRKLPSQGTVKVWIEPRPESTS